MTEKRFAIKSQDDYWAVIDNYDEVCIINGIHTEIEAVWLCEFMNEQQTTIDDLKQRLYDFEKRKIIEESKIDEDVIPKIKILRTELFDERW